MKEHITKYEIIRKIDIKPKSWREGEGLKLAQGWNKLFWKEKPLNTIYLSKEGQGYRWPPPPDTPLLFHGILHTQ